MDALSEQVRAIVDERIHAVVPDLIRSMLAGLLTGDRQQTQRALAPVTSSCVYPDCARPPLPGQPFCSLHDSLGERQKRRYRRMWEAGKKPARRGRKSEKKR